MVISESVIPGPFLKPSQLAPSPPPSAALSPPAVLPPPSPPEPPPDPLPGRAAGRRAAGVVPPPVVVPLPGRSVPPAVVSPAGGAARPCRAGHDLAALGGPAGAAVRAGHVVRVELRAAGRQAQGEHERATA